MSLIEAALCGAPLVSVNAGIAAEITENIAETGNHQSLADKIIYVIKNYAAEKQKALSKKEEIINKYSLKNTTKGFVELYKRVLSY
jgi:glycosyltransferase involved in cell wall biosynthesis